MELPIEYDPDPDLHSQKEMYWLLTDQIIPPHHNFRARITEEHEQDWKKFDLSKLYKLFPRGESLSREFLSFKT
jgi:L-ascorbate metabolism protein UlaG (beta-lactamase superfamily)